MHYKLILCLCVVLMGCMDNPSKKEVPIQTNKKDSVYIQSESLRVYQLQTNASIDSLLFSMEAFMAFKSTIEDLSKLNPAGIDPFLEEAINKSNVLLTKAIPAPFDAPDIKSRLKVIKTALLKAHYYSQENNEEELNKSLKEIYSAYQAYLMRIEDFGQNGFEITQENELRLGPLPQTKLSVE